MLTVKQEKLFSLFLPALVLFIFLLRLITGFSPGILLSSTPDSVEPFTGALRMCQGLNFGFTLNGEIFPSRYSPSLSVLLMPFLLLSPTPEAAGAAIGFWAMILMLFAVLLFHKDKEYGGTALTCALLFMLPCFLEYCGSVMTEIPYSALLFIMLWLFRNMIDLEKNVPKLFLLYGIAAAICGSLRMTGYPMLLPAAWVLFTLCKRQKNIFISSWLFLLLPSLLTTLFSAIFNYLVFGSPSRSGYHFHTPVPYDFPELLFSFSYIPRNIIDSLKWGRGILILGAAILSAGTFCLLCRKKSLPCSRAFKAECCFIFLQLLILTLLYFPHCYFCMRFFLPVISLFVWLLLRSSLGILRALNIFTDDGITKAAWLIGIELMLIAFFCPQQDYCGKEITALRHFSKVLPEQALLIHNYDPGRVELFFVHHPGRKQLPASRQHEYAGKIALRKSITDPVPRPENILVHRSEYLHNAPGKIDFFPKVLEESPKQLIAGSLSGKIPVYITGNALNALTRATYFTLRENFLIKQVFQTPQGELLFQIFPFRENLTSPKEN